MAYRVPKDRWVFRVAPQLTGKAQQAYAAMAAENTGDYDQLKAAIFQRYSITEETYHVRFRSVARAREESYTEMATRVMDLTRKCADVDEVQEVIAVEQLLNSMPVGIRIWVRERKPKTVAEAGRLADDYTEARGSVESQSVQEAAREPSRIVSGTGNKYVVSAVTRTSVPHSQSVSATGCQLVTRVQPGQVLWRRPQLRVLS